MEIVLKNTSWHKNNMIYVIKQEGLYQNKVNSSLIFSRNCQNNGLLKNNQETHQHILPVNCSILSGFELGFDHWGTICPLG